MAYDVGDKVKLSVTFEVDGSRIDPDAVTLKVKSPGGTTTTYTGDGVVKIATGKYRKDVAVDAAGVWAYRWTGTGRGHSAIEGEFLVKRSAFAA